MNPVHVDLGDRSYDIRFGPLSGLGEALAALRSTGPCVLVSNDRVAPLHAEAALASLRGAGFTPRLEVLPDGEHHKTLDTWRGLVEALLRGGIERSTPLISLGGGVTGDMVGFAAASTLRGLPFVQVPTSLLAMVDASVGGKTGVNTQGGKNLIGAFYQPKLVWIARETLTTLDDAELRCGLGEVVKHAVLADPELFAWLETEGRRLLLRDPDAIDYVVGRCCEIKAAVVVADEREAGQRALLNLGHTVGHALEHALGYGALRHGEAVGLGMVAEAWCAVERGLAEASLPPRIAELLRSLDLPWRCPSLSDAALLEGLGMDKKRAHGRLRAAIPVRLGEARLVVVEPGELVTACHRAVQGLEDR